MAQAAFDRRSGSLRKQLFQALDELALAHARAQQRAKEYREYHAKAPGAAAAGVGRGPKPGAGGAPPAPG